MGTHGRRTERAIVNPLPANAMTIDGVPYDLNGDTPIDGLEQALRAMANDVYNAINAQGSI